MQPMPHRIRFIGFCGGFFLRQPLPPSAALLFGLAVGALARADIIELTDKGRAEILEQKLAVPRTHAHGGAFLQGQIIVRRDDNDRPVLPEPRSFFIFRPLPECRPPAPPEQDKADLDPEHPFDVKLRFAWTRGMTPQIDTLDDVRGLISNRDLRHRNGNEALAALLTELDPSGVLGLGQTAPALAEPGVAPREGWLSQFLLQGPTSAEDRAASIRRAQTRPAEDPLGYNPIDPLHWLASGAVALESLLDGAARAQRHGEPEPGVRASCLAVARFICASLFVTRDDIPAGARPLAQRLNAFTLDARQNLRACLTAASPRLANPVQRVTPPDDLQPLDVFDRAQAALDVAEACTDARVPDSRDLIDALLSCATGTTDFSGRSFPAPSAASLALGQRAFEVLVKLASPPELGAAFRTQLLSTVFAANDASTARAARTAVVRAGIGTDREISAVLDVIFQAGITSSEASSVAREHAAYLLKAIPANLADLRRQQLFHTERRRRLDEIAARLEAGSGSRGEKAFLDLVRAAP